MMFVQNYGELLGEALHGIARPLELGMFNINK